MTSKQSAITLSSDEIMRMKMKANLIPNCTNFHLSKIMNRMIVYRTCINNLYYEHRSGRTILRILKKEKNKKGSENSKNNNLKEEELMMKKENINKMLNKKSFKKQTKKCS